MQSILKFRPLSFLFGHRRPVNTALTASLFSASLVSASLVLLSNTALGTETEPSTRATRLEQQLRASSQTDRAPSQAAATKDPHADKSASSSSPSLLRVGAFGAGQLALQYTAIRVWDPPNWHDFGNSPSISAGKFFSNFAKAPVFEPERLGGGGLLGVTQADGDSWKTNIVGHGLQGTELYLRMRREGFSGLHASLGGLIQSTIWEYGVEGMHETPSLWDLLWTPSAGAAFGELRYRALRLAQKRSGVFWNSLRVIVDPVGELDHHLERWLYKRP